MVDKTYSYFSGLLKNNSQLSDNTSIVSTISDLSVQNIRNTAQVQMAFCNSLKEVLEIDDTQLMIQAVFSIESQLEHLKENEFFKNIFLMDDFFRNLSPILLRSVFESAGLCSVNGAWGDSFKEALRVAIEEEIYVLSEELGELPSGTLL